MIKIYYITLIAVNLCYIFLSFVLDSDIMCAFGFIMLFIQISYINMIFEKINIKLCIKIFYMTLAVSDLCYIFLGILEKNKSMFALGIICFFILMVYADRVFEK